MGNKRRVQVPNGSSCLNPCHRRQCGRRSSQCKRHCLSPCGLHHNSSHHKQPDWQNHQRRGSGRPPGLESSRAHGILKSRAMPITDNLCKSPMHPPGMKFLGSRKQREQQHCLTGEDVETALHGQQQQGSHTVQHNSHKQQKGWPQEGSSINWFPFPARESLLLP